MKMPSSSGFKMDLHEIPFNTSFQLGSTNYFPIILHSNDVFL